METLKSITLSKGTGGNINIAVQLEAGGAAATFWPGDSAGVTIKKLNELVENLKKGILDRALQ